MAFKIKAEEIWLDIDQAIPCGLVINELITNSLKYAFQNGDSGKITIRAKMTDAEEMELEVKDNGIGLPEGLEWGNTETLGLGLVKLVAEGQLGAKVELQRNGGTSFRIRFKTKRD